MAQESVSREVAVDVPRATPRKRKSHRELSDEARRRANCRAYTNQLIRRGVLDRQPCEDCGSAIDIQPHHEDYSDPRNVHWKCKTCHRKHHRPERLSLKCYDCKGERDRPGQALCKACHRNYMRAYRVTQKQKRLDMEAELQSLRQKVAS